MSTSPGYALANSTSGEYVSKAVPTLAEAQELLETVYAHDRDNLMVHRIWSHPPAR
jgi:putative lipoic acid-binding regulatory protein